MRNISAIGAFVHSDDGATAAEYAVMLAAVFLALIVGATLFGDGVELWWTRNKNEIDAI
jgi:Flp pilus assembly pilin Flp